MTCKVKHFLLEKKKKEIKIKMQFDASTRNVSGTKYLSDKLRT